MPISEIEENRVIQTCANCDNTSDVSFEDIEVGTVRDDKSDDAVIPLPICTSCGAREFLVRSAKDEPEHPAPGCYGHKHRLLTDLLHARLVKNGRLAEGMDPKKVHSRKPDKKTLSRWFKNGLRLERPNSKKEREQDD
ncbi:MAG: hypothetical protein QNJ97_26450 [Myxococcota bacterium]|nr:hypothetical protein [Myxococcota bacterium]